MARALLLLLLAPVAAQAQDDLPPVTYPAIVTEADAAAGFVPRGWTLEIEVAGDLDGDGRSDLALVLHGNDPAARIAGLMCEDPFDSNARMLVVALARAGGGYRRVVADTRFIPRRESACAQDWFEPGAVRIERGVLSLKFDRFMNAGGWGSGSNRFAFRWQGGALRLIGWDYGYLARNSGETAAISINYLTRRVKTERGFIDEADTKVRWSTLARAPLLTIDQVGDAMLFDPGGRVAGL